MRILILDGYGVFSGRLADIAMAQIVIAGRNLKEAQEFCRVYRGEATVEPLRLNRKQIGEIAPDLVVDASNPFQDYGGNRYTVVETCIASRIPYLDLADASGFVVGISQFDDAAKGTSVFVPSGVSSFPVLPAAAVRQLSQHMEPISVTAGDALSPYAGVGLNVMRAITAYTSGPVRLMRDGEWADATGLGESRRHTIARPGKLPLRNIHFSLVDASDVRLVPRRYATLKDIWIGASPVPEVLHRLLNLLARSRATFRLPSVACLNATKRPWPG